MKKKIGFVYLIFKLVELSITYKKLIDGEIVIVKWMKKQEM